MESISPRYSRASQLQSSASSSKQRRSGYEPSDTETEWQQQESPWRDHNKKNGVLGSPKNVSPMKHSRRHSSIQAGVTSPVRRRHSRSPYKPQSDDGNTVSPKPGSDLHRNVSPFSKSERRSRHVSPFKGRREDQNLGKEDEIVTSNNRKQYHRLHNNHLVPEENHPDHLEATTRVGEKLNYSRRSLSATRPRGRERDEQNNYGHTEKRGGERTSSPLARSQTQKEREASHVKVPSRVQACDAPNFESIESILPGDIFFSRDCTALAMQKNVLPKNGVESRFATKPKIIAEREYASNPRNGQNGSYGHGNPRNSSCSKVSRTTTISSSAVRRQSSGRISTASSKMRDASGRTTASMSKFTANRRKSQSETNWFSCMRKGPCKTSKSPEHRAFDEASFIEKAFVVQELRQFWADKHRPSSLNGFTCQKQQAQLLKQLVSRDICPHIMFKGPSGSGKGALAMALLREIYGDTSWNISHELRYFNIQEKGPMKVVTPLTSSPHHVEFNVYLEPKAIYALMALVKEISNNYAIAPEVSDANVNTNYKVIVLYEVDKAADNIQHLIKWVMDRYSDSCKLILCCEDDVDILESVKTRCKVINVDAPVTHEIMEVLIQIARKENFDLSMSFAAKIATKSKQNLRKAIMALEACKAHNYPFFDDQPIPFGWEEVLVELAAEILDDPSPKRLVYIRGKLQKLLVDFVHPKLILQKLVEQFLRRVDAGLKRELFYWHGYYDKRLPTGTSALLKLEEFTAKFMSIHRKSFSNRQFA